jgi:nucleoid-associated protein YgaU
MMQREWLKVLVYGVAITGMVFIGCAKQPTPTLSVGEAPAVQQETVVPKQAAADPATVRPLPEPPPCDQDAAAGKIKPAVRSAEPHALPTAYVVRQGDSLWWIAKYRDIYNDPYLWPVLYNANRNVIKDPDRITPGMKLQIPRAGFKQADIQNARKTAGAPRPYNPPARAVPPAD